MRRSIGRFAGLLPLSLLALVSCKRSDDKPQEAMLTSASVDLVSTSIASDRIAAARCAREVMCASLGGIDQPFVSYEGCIRDVSGRLRADIAEMRCPPVVERAGVEVCLREIGNESCGDAVDAIERIQACRTSTLCGRGGGQSEYPRTQERLP
jgi:hypothetical protein